MACASCWGNQFFPPRPSSGTPLIIPSGFGFVVLTALGSVALLAWKSIKVELARDEFSLPSHLTHSPSHPEFNCVQRSRQNALENYPQFIFALLIGGLQMPYFSTAGGIIWIFGKICFVSGESSQRGYFGLIGMGMCSFATFAFAANYLL